MIKKIVVLAVCVFMFQGVAQASNAARIRQLSTQVKDEIVLKQQLEDRKKGLETQIDDVEHSIICTLAIIGELQRQDRTALAQEKARKDKQAQKVKEEEVIDEHIQTDNAGNIKKDGDESVPMEEKTESDS